jgi:predicted site-specific integrase-resolvase
MVYAHKQGISRRTLDRYARLGKVETKKRLGWTYVVDKPIKSTSDKTDYVGPDKKTEHMNALCVRLPFYLVT